MFTYNMSLIESFLGKFSGKVYLYLNSTYYLNIQINDIRINRTIYLTSGITFIVKDGRIVKMD